ncbi:MAG: phosphoenolpyruvate carboxykinase (ATP) [bacterium]
MSKYPKTETPAQPDAAALASRFGLENCGVKYLRCAYWNLADEALRAEMEFRGEDPVAPPGGAGAVDDTYVVHDDLTAETVWWGEYNRPFSAEKFTNLLTRVQAYLQGRDVFVRDCYVGNDVEHRLPLRIVAENAGTNLLARELFASPADPEEFQTFVPSFTLIAAPDFHADPIHDATRSETAIVLNFSRRLAVVVGTDRGEEIGNVAETALNFLRPGRAGAALSGRNAVLRPDGPRPNGACF